jgi:hypothetical protein
LLEFDSHRR